MADTSSSKRKREDDLDQLDDRSDQGAMAIYYSREVPAMKPWMDLLHEYRSQTALSALQMLSREMLAFEAYTLPHVNEHRRRGGVIKRIETYLRHVFPGLTMHVSGSYLTRTYLPDGDIDVTITWPPSRDTYAAEGYPNSFLKHIAELLSKPGYPIGQVKHIPYARVPILKLQTHYGNFPVDISVDALDSGLTGQLVNHFLDTEPAMRSILMIMKLFLAQQNLNEPKDGGLSTYALVLMVYSYLQLRQRLQRPTASLSSETDSFGPLMLDFLFYYGNIFNFREVVISVRNGGQYFTTRAKEWASSNDTPSSSTPHIEDPFNISRSLAAACSRLPALIQAFKRGYDVLYNATLSRQAQIDSAAGKPWGDYIEPFDVNGGSIVGSLIGFESKDVLARRHMDDTFPLAPLEALIQTSNV